MNEYIRLGSLKEIYYAEGCTVFESSVKFYINTTFESHFLILITEIFKLS